MLNEILKLLDLKKNEVFECYGKFTGLVGEFYIDDEGMFSVDGYESGRILYGIIVGAFEVKKVAN